VSGSTPFPKANKRLIGLRSAPIRYAVCMKKQRRFRVCSLCLFLTLLVASIPARTHAETSPPRHSFGIAGRQFLLDGKPFEIISGSMHYTRMPRARRGEGARNSMQRRFRQGFMKGPEIKGGGGSGIESTPSAPDCRIAQRTNDCRAGAPTLTIQPRIWEFGSLLNARYLRHRVFLGSDSR